MLASRLVSEFRKGRVDDGLVRTAQTDGFHAFGLAAAAGTRPSLLRHTLPLDDDFLRRAARQVAASPHAGKRLGREWSNVIWGVPPNFMSIRERFCCICS